MAEHAAVQPAHDSVIDTYTTSICPTSYKSEALDTDNYGNHATQSEHQASLAAWAF